MTTTPNYPVDSRTRSCCQGIGCHTLDCPVDNLPSPAGASHVCGWADPEIAGELYRAFRGSSWIVERSDQRDDVRVSIDGVQYPDGRVERDVFVDNADANGLTAAQARQLARSLFAAADELDRWAQR